MLNEEQYEKLRLTLQGDGWNHVMKPALANRGRLAMKALVLTRAERSQGEFKSSDFDVDDDLLRAIVRDCEWMVACWDNEVRMYDHNRRIDELDSRPITANP